MCADILAASRKHDVIVKAVERRGIEPLQENYQASVHTSAAPHNF